MLQARLFRYSLPLRMPVQLGAGWHSAREGLLVQISDSRGREGWGEIAPLPSFSPETLNDSLRAMQAVQSELSTIDNLRARLQQPDLPSSVRAGLEQACWQITSPNTWHAGCKVRLQGLLAGSREHALQEAHQLSDSKAFAVKLKVGRTSIHEDIRLTREICSLLPEAQIRLDANQAWGLAQAREFITGIADCQIDYLEEPVYDRTDLRQLLEASDIPIALDETLRNNDRDDLCSAARIYVIKPALMGGLRTAEAFIRKAMDTGKRCIVSSAWESGIGMHAALQLAAGLPKEAHGLDTYRFLSSDVLRSRLSMTSSVCHLPVALPSEGNIDWRHIKPVEGP